MLQFVVTLASKLALCSACNGISHTICRNNEIIHLDSPLRWQPRLFPIPLLMLLYACCSLWGHLSACYLPVHPVAAHLPFVYRCSRMHNIFQTYPTQKDQVCWGTSDFLPSLMMCMMYVTVCGGTCEQAGSVHSLWRHSPLCLLAHGAGLWY